VTKQYNKYSLEAKQLSEILSTLVGISLSGMKEIKV
jgi:hypothetical protein